MVGRRVLLRAIEPSDYEALYRLETDPDLNYRWRLGGLMPSREQWTNSLNDGVFVMFAIADRHNVGSLLGVVTVFNADHRNRVFSLAAAAFPRYRGAGVVIEGVYLCIDYCFTIWDFRKAYLEAPAYNFEQFASAVKLGFAREEGRLTDHHYHASRYWDRVILTIDRPLWIRAQSQLPVKTDGRSTRTSRMTRSEFVTWIADALSLPHEVVTLESHLVEDLGFDSLSLLTIHVLVETETATEIPLALVPQLVTVGDLFDYYSSHLQHS